MRAALNISLSFLAISAIAQVLTPAATAQPVAGPPACGRVLTDPDFPRPLLSDTSLAFDDLRYLDLDGDGVVEPIGYARLAYQAGARDYQLYRGTFGPDGKITYEALLPPMAVAAFSSPEELLAGDLDGDGVNDLAVFWKGDNFRDGPKHLDVHRGLGNGLVAPPERYTWPRADPSGLPLLADFDADGRQELVVQWKRCLNPYWCPEAYLDVWSWDAFGGFVNRFRQLGPASQERAPAVLDVDGDGLDDLVTEHGASSTTSELGVRHGDRASLLGPLRIHGLPYRSNGVYAMDLDGSGRERLVVVESPRYWFYFSPTRLHRIESLAPNVVDGWTQTILSSLFSTPAVAEDLDGDGRTDLVFRQPGGGLFFGGPGGFHVFWGEGDEPLAEGQRSRTTPLLLASIDVDADGVRDLLANPSSTSGARPTFYPARTPRQFDEGALTTPLSYGQMDEPYIDTSVADLNGDGLDDVLTLTLYHRALTVALARGDGSFEVSELPIPDEYWWDVDLHDMDGDGNLDMVIVPGYVSSEIGVAPGRGDGTFDPVRRFDLGGTFHRFWFGDLDGDGKKDLVTETYPQTQTRRELVSFVERDGAFTRGTSLVITARFHMAAALADLDGDGRADLIYERRPDPSDEPTRISWRRSLGGGRFGSETDVIDETFPVLIREIAVTDFDLDRKADLLVRLRRLTSGDYLSIRGDGRGGFRLLWRGDADDHPGILTDVNGDGRPDLVQRQPGEYGYDATRTYATYVRLGDGLGGFGEPLENKWLSFGGHAGVFRNRGGRDLVRVGAIDGRFQLEVNPNLGQVLARDVAPPEVEVGVTPIIAAPADPGTVDVRWQLTMVPTDECDSRPRITRSVVDLVPLGARTTVSFVPAAEQEVHVFERGGVSEVVLSGPDEDAARAAFVAARDAGGYPFESFGVLRLAAADRYGPRGDAFGARGRLTQHLKLRGGLVVEAAVYRPGGDVTFSIDAADRSGRTGTTRLGYLAFRRETIAAACADPDHPGPLCAAR